MLSDARPQQAAARHTQSHIPTVDLAIEWNLAQKCVLQCMASVPASFTTAAEGNLQRVLSVADTAEDGVAPSYYFRYGDLGYEQIAEPKQRFSRST